MERLTVFDTTLRDGEQAPGFSMRLAEKLEMAKALATLGVDVIEAGFPAASPDDQRAVQTIAERIDGPVICGLARCTRLDIEAAARALAPAERRRLHVFLATSAIHRQHKLKMAKAQILSLTREGIEQARAHTDDVEFSPEDASRTERDFLAEVVETAIEAGATTINVPDTVGYTTPAEFEDLFAWLVANVRGIEGITLSVHCHNDLGLAVANSLAAVRGGARQVECTINGIGERAGNCALEELVMALRTRPDQFGELETGIDTTRLVNTSRLLSSITGVMVPSNKAIVGKNAFAHEAGIHQHGVISHASTYEIMRPEDVGFDGQRFVLGKHSGRHALRERLATMGHELAPETFEALFVAFKELADRKGEVFDEDLQALVLGAHKAQAAWTLARLQTSAGTDRISTATVCVQRDGTAEVNEAATGDGPIDATFRAMTRATGYADTHLDDYQVRSVTWGEDALGQVTVVIRRGDAVVRGSGVSTDIIEASAHAILDVINHWAGTEAPRAVS
ncbi:MAG: 2-isopropylmalate synthase [Myxococcota bacterium]